MFVLMHIWLLVFGTYFTLIESKPAGVASFVLLTTLDSLHLFRHDRNVTEMNHVVLQGDI